MTKLQQALLANAIFSSLSGIGLLTFSSFIAQLFDSSNLLVFRIIGAALLFFSLTILYEIRYQNKKRVNWIILQDLLWVIGSIILLIAQPFGISFIGNVLIAVVALIVLGMAIGQWRGLHLLSH